MSMPPALARCVSLRPDLFWWAGPPQPSRLNAWLHGLGFPVPDDLAAFWVETGGGTVFETEELLCPMGPTVAAGGVEEQSAWHRTAGLPEDLLLFHEGAWLSALRVRDGRYVTLGPGYEPATEFGSLDEWFRATLLAEYGERYGVTGAL
jgi:hypothetical protein